MREAGLTRKMGTNDTSAASLVPDAEPSASAVSSAEEQPVVLPKVELDKSLPVMEQAAQIAKLFRKYMQVVAGGNIEHLSLDILADCTRLKHEAQLLADTADSNHHKIVVAYFREMEMPVEMHSFDRLMREARRVNKKMAAVVLATSVLFLGGGKIYTAIDAAQEKAAAESVVAKGPKQLIQLREEAGEKSANARKETILGASYSAIMHTAEVANEAVRKYNEALAQADPKDRGEMQPLEYVSK